MNKAQRHSVWVERLKKEDGRQECHSCGKVGFRRFLIHLGHLCQHYVGLCSRCYGTVARRIWRFGLKGA